MHQSLRLRVSRLAGSGLLLLLAAPLAAQDFEGVFTSKVQSPQGAMEMKMSVKGARYRVDFAMAGQGAIAMIGDPAAGEIYMLMPTQQMAMVMKLPEAEKLTEQANAREVKLTPTGRTETVAGHECEYYRFTEGKNTTDICFAAGLGGFKGAASMFGPPGRGGMTAAPPWARELLRKGSFPLKVVSGEGTPIWEVVSVERKSLSADLFIVPADYRRMDMPSFGRPPSW
jgi:hypothetical protein